MSSNPFRNRPIPPNPSPPSTTPSASKKRKSHEMLLTTPDASEEDREYNTLRTRLLSTHNLLVSVDPIVLHKYILAKLDDALMMSLPSNRRRLSLAGDALSSRGVREGNESHHHRRTNSLSSASFPGTGGLITGTGSTSSDPRSGPLVDSSSISSIPGSTDIIPITTSTAPYAQLLLPPSSWRSSPSSPSLTSSALSNSALNPIRAFSLIFEDFSSVYIPSPTATRTITTPRSRHHHHHLGATSHSNHPSISSASTSSSSPITSRSSGNSSHHSYTILEQPEEESEVHCVRCHSDFIPLKNNSRSCFVEHDWETLFDLGEGKYKYECCDYEFTSETLPPAFPKDPSKVTEKESFCFVGKHTVDENVVKRELEARKMNVFFCEESGCWEEEEEIGDDEDEDEAEDKAKR